MFKTLVIKTKIIRKKEDKSRSLLLILGVWFVLFFVFFIMYCKGIYWAAIPCLIDFFSIIPIKVIGYKKLAPYKKNSSYSEEVTFESRDGQLYAEGQKITSIVIDTRRKEIYVDNIDLTKVRMVGGTICTDEPVFCGMVESPYMEAFEEYLRSNNIENIEVHE